MIKKIKSLLSLLSIFGAEYDDEKFEKYVLAKSRSNLRSMQNTISTPKDNASVFGHHKTDWNNKGSVESDDNTHLNLSSDELHKKAEDVYREFFAKK